MRKIISSMAIAALFVIAGSSIALADYPKPSETRSAPQSAPPTPKHNNRHGIFGTVTKIKSPTFTVQTKQGDVIVTVTSSTKFHLPRKANASFTDLAVGDRVAVNGTPSVSGLTAKRVAIVPGKPTIRHRVGTVTAYTADVSITIQDVQGGTETFVVTKQTIIKPKGTGVALGDRVTIVSRRDPSTDAFTATGIVVHSE